MLMKVSLVVVPFALNITASSDDFSLIAMTVERLFCLLRKDEQYLLHKLAMCLNMSGWDCTQWKMIYPDAEDPLAI
jgi:hypothetical protein